MVARHQAAQRKSMLSESPLDRLLTSAGSFGAWPASGIAHAPMPPSGVAPAPNGVAASAETGKEPITLWRRREA